MNRQSFPDREDMPDAMVVQWIREKYEALRGTLNERARRLWAAAEARSLGRGGIAAVIAATGMSSATVHKGLKELEAGSSGGEVLPPGRVRRPGGGRKRARDKQPGLANALPRHQDVVLFPARPIQAIENLREKSNRMILRDALPQRLGE